MKKALIVVVLFSYYMQIFAKDFIGISFNVGLPIGENSFDHHMIVSKYSHPMWPAVEQKDSIGFTNEHVNGYFNDVVDSFYLSRTKIINKHASGENNLMYDFQTLMYIAQTGCNRFLRTDRTAGLKVLDSAGGPHIPYMDFTTKRGTQKYLSTLVDKDDTVGVNVPFTINQKANIMPQLYYLWYGSFFNFRWKRVDKQEMPYSKNPKFELRPQDLVFSLIFGREWKDISVQFYKDFYDKKILFSYDTIVTTGKEKQEIFNTISKKPSSTDAASQEKTGTVSAVEDKIVIDAVPSSFVFPSTVIGSAAGFAPALYFDGINQVNHDDTLDKNVDFYIPVHIMDPGRSQDEPNDALLSEVQAMQSNYAAIYANVGW